jgi:hypothetical protein
MTPEDYVAYITGWHKDKPRFVETVKATVAPFADAFGEVAAIYAKFDLDTALGPQLDVTGELIGLSRNIPVPLPTAFFTWGDPARGWGTGIWKGPYDTEYGISRLDDTTYRRLLKAKVKSNTWDGTVPGAQEILDTYFTDPETHVFVQDMAQSAYPGIYFTWGDPTRGWGKGIWYSGQEISSPISTFDMKMVVGVSGKWPISTDLAILGRGLLPIKPEGVRLDYKVTSVNGKPLFGFGMDNEYVAGWGKGTWGVSPANILARL